VLDRLSKRLRHAEIAEQLGIAPHTLSTHIHHLDEKLHAHSAAGAVGKWLDPGETGRD
jgi:DNA-binding CsgD family transcriptional regulator